MSEVIDITMETIILKALSWLTINASVGYKEDDIRAFLPRSVRNVENAGAYLESKLYKIAHYKRKRSLNKPIC